MAWIMGASAGLAKDWQLLASVGRKYRLSKFTVLKPGLHVCSSFPKLFHLLSQNGELILSGWGGEQKRNLDATCNR